jgi:hypothetical protein
VHRLTALTICLAFLATPAMTAIASACDGCCRSGSTPAQAQAQPQASAGCCDLTSDPAPLPAPPSDTPDGPDQDTPLKGQCGQRLACHCVPTVVAMQERSAPPAFQTRLVELTDTPHAVVLMSAHLSQLKRPPRAVTPS